MNRTQRTVRHYYRSARRPFLNLSDLGAAEAELVRSELVAEGQAGKNSRQFGRRYMELRHRTEAKMRSLFVAGGGQPERTAPHYFILGESNWFAGLSSDMTLVELPLTSLPADQTSFTYPDSFTAMALAQEYQLPYERRPYHEKVFQLSELDAVVEEFGLPADPGAGGYEGYANRPFEMYIEVQLWSDRPVGRFLS